MSAMPARAPRLNPITSKSKRLGRLALVNPKVIVTPIAHALPVSIPTGKANRSVFQGIIMGMLAFGALLLLLVNTKSQQAAFEKHALQGQLNQMIATQQQLATEVALAESTNNLVTAARTLGMVPAATPVFMRVSDQVIVGSPVPAKAVTVPIDPVTGQPVAAVTPVKR